MADTSTITASDSVAGAIVNEAVAGAAAEATNALGLAESKAELYALTHLFGTTNGTAYYQVLTGNATAQSILAEQNIKGISWLESIFVREVEPTLFSALSKVGLA